MKNWLSKTVLLLSVVSLFNDFAGELLYPILPLYLLSIGYGVIWIGLLEGIAEAVAGLTKAWFGEWSDNKGMRLPFIRIGYLLSALSKPLLALFAFAPWVILMRTTDRIGKGVRTGARDAMLADEVGKEHRGKVFGFHRSMDTFGAVIGPSLALVWLAFHQGEDFHSLFLFSLIPGMLCVLLLFFVKEKKRQVKSNKLPTTSFLSFTYWKKASPDFRKLVIGIVGFTLFNSSDMFLLLLVKIIFSKGIVLGSYSINSDMLVVAFYVFYNLVYSLFSFPAGILADKFGSKRMLLLGYACFALAYGGMAWVAFINEPNLIFVIFCFMIYGFYSACTDGISKAWLSNLCANEDKGVALGLYAGLTSMATLIASVTAGVLWSFKGPAIVFLLGATMAIIVFFYINLVCKSPQTKFVTNENN